MADVTDMTDVTDATYITYVTDATSATDVTDATDGTDGHRRYLHDDREAEINDLEETGRIEQNVLGLQIAVGDVALV